MSMLAEKLRHKLIARDKELLARQTELNAMLDVLKEQARQLRAYEQGDSPKVGDLQTSGNAGRPAAIRARSHDSQRQADFDGAEKRRRGPSG